MSILISASNTDREEMRVALATVEDDEVDQVIYQNSSNGKLIYQTFNIKQNHINESRICVLNVQEAGVGLPSPPPPPVVVGHHAGHFLNRTSYHHPEIWSSVYLFKLTRSHP